MRVFNDKKTGNYYVAISTRAPIRMHVYAKTLACSSGKTMKTMHREAVEQFLQEKPWEHGLQWRPTQVASTTLKEQDKSMASGWLQVYIRIPLELGKQLEKLAIEHDVPIASVSYTVLYWWTWWIHPPLSERVRRDAYLRKDLVTHGDCAHS